MIALALGILLTAMSATAQKTAYGYTMLPATTQAMYSFDLSDVSATNMLGTYSKAEPRSGAIAKGTLYMMGIDDDFYTWFYRMDLSTGESETISKVGDITIPGDMSYDYTTETMYFISNSEVTDGVSAIGTVDLETGNTTYISDLPYFCKALAIDGRGQMYVLANNGFLFKTNKSTGECTRVGNTGVKLASWWNFQSIF